MTRQAGFRSENKQRLSIERTWFGDRYRSLWSLGLHAPSMSKRAIKGRPDTCFCTLILCISDPPKTGACKLNFAGSRTSRRPPSDWLVFVLRFFNEDRFARRKVLFLFSFHFVLWRIFSEWTWQSTPSIRWCFAPWSDHTICFWRTKALSRRRTQKRKDW